LAAESASAVGAAAYAYGNNVVFAKNQFSPASPAGRGVLAHELAHVAQTRSEIPSGGPQRVSSPSDASESEAQAIAERVTAAMSPSLEQDWNSPKATTDVSRTLSRLVGPATTHCVPESRAFRRIHWALSLTLIPMRKASLKQRQFSSNSLQPVWSWALPREL